MIYEDVLKFLYSQLPIFQRVGKAAYKSDLSNTLVLDKFYKHPHCRFKTIHIAGTNGKGSVSHMLAAILQKAGYKTGLYTSPHLKDFRERIKIDGKPVSKDFVIKFIEKSQDIITQVNPSFFELTVLMAFDYFAVEKVDIAIIETGMGGRLDSTNIIMPELSIITNITYDHTAFLGKTLPEIASEKAGIIKKKIPVVIGEKQSETVGIFQKKAHEQQSEITFAENYYRIEYGLEDFQGKIQYNVKQNEKIIYPQLVLDLLGYYQQKNLITTLCAITKLKDFTISRQHIYDGLADVIALTGLQGRWQVLQYNPMVVLDIAHNEAGLSEVFRQVKNTPYENLHIVAGFVNDKEVDKILRLFPRDANYYFTEAKIPRALSVNKVITKAKINNLKGVAIKSVPEAFSMAVNQADKNDLVIVTGSAFVVAEVLEFAVKI